VIFILSKVVTLRPGYIRWISAIKAYCEIASFKSSTYATAWSFPFWESLLYCAVRPQ